MDPLVRLPLAYTYTPISSARRLRVVNLLYAERSHWPWSSDTVHVEIKEVAVDNPEIPYDCLSYTWNVTASSKADRRIVVHTGNVTGQLSIYPSLEEALLHLVKSKSVLSRPLFIDQISINQDDQAEKAVQVRLMRDIYSNCLRTVIWLGPGTTASDTYFDFVNLVAHDGSLARLMGPHVSVLSETFGAIMNPSVAVEGTVREDRDDIVSLLSNHGSGYPLRGVTDVMSRSWWSRLWIIQEACLAPQVLFLCGTRTACFDCFRAGCLFYTFYNTWWVNHSNQHVPKAELEQRNSIFDEIQSFIRIYQERKKLHSEGIRAPLYSLLLKYSVNDGRAKIGATWPEDRVFGLFGLIGDVQRWDEVAVRYGDCWGVYTEIADLMIQENLDLLLFAQKGRQRANQLPTWVPDWAMDLKTPYCYQNLSTPVWKAGGDVINTQPVVDIQTGTLSVKGYIVGRITRLGKVVVKEDDTSLLEGQMDYVTNKLFSDELVDMIMQSARMPESPYGMPSAIGNDNQDDGQKTSLQKEDVVQHLMRIKDWGLTFAKLSQSYDEPSLQQVLRTIHQQTDLVGETQIRALRIRDSYKFPNVIKRLGTLPWYWLPPDEMAALRSYATRPRQAWHSSAKASVLFAVDLVRASYTSALVLFWPKLSELRKRWRKVNITAGGDGEAMKRVGLDPNIINSVDMHTYRDNVFKCVGTKAFVMDGGRRVGMAVGCAREGDVIAILRGGTTAHVLRDSASPGRYEYVGEAYCDGLMNGEAIDGSLTLQSLTLI